MAVLLLYAHFQHDNTIPWHGHAQILQAAHAPSLGNLSVQHLVWHPSISTKQLSYPKGKSPLLTVLYQWAAKFPKGWSLFPFSLFPDTAPLHDSSYEHQREMLNNKHASNHMQQASDRMVTRSCATFLQYQFTARSTGGLRAPRSDQSRHTMMHSLPVLQLRKY